MANIVNRIVRGPQPQASPVPGSYSAAELAGMEQEQAAERVTLQRVEEAGAIARPDAVTAGTWVEHEYDELEQEQAPQWEASGVKESRPAEVHAAGLRPARAGDERVVESHTPFLSSSARRCETAYEVLAPYRRRTGGKLIHYGIKSALVLGDAVGVTLLGINIGDIPVLAGLMSISAATAAVTAGLVGAEYRNLQSAERRAKPADELSEAEQPFKHFFMGADAGRSTVKLMTWAGITAALLIGLAIFAGRAEIEGLLVGALYGGIALAVAIASFIESYMYADDIADHLDGVSKQYDQEIKRHQRLSGADAWRTQLMRETEAASIREEHSARGKAAQDRVRALKWGILRRNPGVMGHGPAAPSSIPVGRTNRKGASR